MTVIRLLAQVQNEIPIVSIAMASQNMARLVAISKRVDALESIVDPHKFQTKMEEAFEFVLAEVNRKYDQIQTVVEDFRRLLARAEKSTGSITQATGVATEFDRIMNEFDSNMDRKLTETNKQIANYHDIMDELGLKAENIQKDIDRLQIRNRLETQETKLVKAEQNIMVIEQKLLQLGTFSSNLAIYAQAAEHTPPARGRSQTTKERSKSLQGAARILRGLTPVHEPHILPEPELLVPERELPTLVLQ